MPSPRGYDLCAGTGCLGLGIARHVPGADVTCVEKSPDAWPYLTANTADSGVRTMQADVFTYYKLLSAECADLIISNPPYLTGPEMGALMPETAHEPAMALDGGADGLDFYRGITELWQPALKPGGHLLYEVGIGQAEKVAWLLVKAGYENIRITRDTGGIDRVVEGQRPKEREIPDMLHETMEEDV